MAGATPTAAATKKTGRGCEAYESGSTAAFRRAITMRASNPHCMTGPEFATHLSTSSVRNLSSLREMSGSTTQAGIVSQRRRDGLGTSSRRVRHSSRTRFLRRDLPIGPLFCVISGPTPRSSLDSRGSSPRTTSRGHASGCQRPVRPTPTPPRVHSGRTSTRRSRPERDPASARSRKSWRSTDVFSQFWRLRAKCEVSACEIQA